MVNPHPYRLARIKRAEYVRCPANNSRIARTFKIQLKMRQAVDFCLENKKDMLLAVFIKDVAIERRIFATSQEGADAKVWLYQRIWPWADSAYRVLKGRYPRSEIRICRYILEDDDNGENKPDTLLQRGE